MKVQLCIQMPPEKKDNWVGKVVMEKKKLVVKKYMYFHRAKNLLLVRILQDFPILPDTYNLRAAR